MRNDRRRNSIAASSAFSPQSHQLSDVRIVGGIIIVTATVNCTRKEVAMRGLVNRDPHNAMQHDRPPSTANPSAATSYRLATTVECVQGRCLRKSCRNNGLRLSPDGIPPCEKRLLPRDEARRNGTRFASRGAAAVDARLCRIVAAIRRDRRCAGAYRGGKQFSPRRCADDVRRTTPTACIFGRSADAQCASRTRGDGSLLRCECRAMSIVREKILLFSENCTCKVFANEYDHKKFLW